MESYIAWAIRWIRNGTFYAVQTDKDGGWCLVPKYCIKALINKKLQTRKYESAPSYSLFDIKANLIQQAERLGRALDDDGLTKWMIDMIESSDIRKIVQQFLFNIKTHKPAGSVSLRLIHSAAGHPGRGISNLIKKSINRL